MGLILSYIVSHTPLVFVKYLFFFQLISLNVLFDTTFGGWVIQGRKEWKCKKQKKEAVK